MAEQASRPTQQVSEQNFGCYPPYRICDAFVEVKLGRYFCEVVDGTDDGESGATIPLLDFYADACVTVDCSDDLVLHSKRSNEFFKSSKFVERARELIEENKISRLQIRR